MSEPVLEGLRAAADRASVRLAGLRGRSAEEFRAEYSVLAEELHRIATGDHRDRDRGGAPPPRFNRRAIDILRSEFLVGYRGGARSLLDPDDMLAVLAAMEELLDQADNPAAGEFLERLASSDAENAVLEIAHDMRSPLTSIIFLVEAVRKSKSGALSPIQDRQLGLIYGAALGLGTLTNDVIDAIRGDRLVDGPPRPFSVSDVMQDMGAIVAPIAEEKRLALTLTGPSVDGRIGHAPALHRVLLNLTANALKYTEAGSVSVACTELDESRLEFSVKDTGGGIPKRVMAMLFDGFRPTGVGTRFSSAALGLVISRDLVEKMGGQLAVETSPEEGTRFSFVLEMPGVKAGGREGREGREER